MNNLTILNVAIRTDLEGRYCLNDLHKAGGEDQKHRPKYWLENKQTIELIQEMSIGGIPPIQSKQQLGTFVAKELVYAYAMWISPAFHLKVIRAYDAMQTNRPDPMAFLNDPQAVRGALLIYSEKVIELEAKVEKDAPKVEGFDRIANAEGSANITETAKALQVQPKKLFERLSFERWIYRRACGKSWLGYQDKIQQGLLTHKVTTISVNGEDKTQTQVLVTSKGIAKLSQLFGFATQG